MTKDNTNANMQVAKHEKKKTRWHRGKFQQKFDCCESALAK